MNEPLWVQSKDAIAIHERQIVEHGGLPGIKGEGLLESAIARPEQQQRALLELVQGTHAR